MPLLGRLDRYEDSYLGANLNRNKTRFGNQPATKTTQHTANILFEDALLLERTDRLDAHYTRTHALPQGSVAMTIMKREKTGARPVMH